MTFPVQAGALLRRTPLLPDESLPSFLERLTRLNHYPSSRMLSGICAERVETGFGQDPLDCPRCAETFVELAHLTQVSAEALFAASHHCFAPAFQLPDQAVETLGGRGLAGLPLLSSVQARCYLRTDTAAQYCPQCLENSPHHRLHWIPTAAAICLEHGCFLVAGCPQCQRPLAIRDVVSRRCPACQADLCSAPKIPVGEDEPGLCSQQWLQGCLSGAPVKEASLPSGHPAILYALVECAARWLSTGSVDGSPMVRYALYRTAFSALRDWPQGLFAILDDICKRDPHPSQRLNKLQQRWFQPSRSGTAYDFMKQAFVSYRVLQELPISPAFAHRWKHARWFVQCTGIWSAEVTAKVLEMPVEDLARFYPNGLLQDCLWVDSRKRGPLFWRKRVLAVRRRWKVGWPLADASCWLGLDEGEVIRLVARGTLALKDGDPQGDSATWLFDRNTVADFFQAVMDRLEPFHGLQDYLVRRFEVDTHLHSVGMDWAQLIQQVLDGLLPAYKRKETICALDDLCFDVDDMDTWPDRWYAMQGLVSDQVFAHETMVSPKWIDKWVAANRIAPVLCFGRVRYYDRAALEQVVANLNIFGSDPLYVKANLPCQRTRLRSKSALARPYIIRFRHFNRLTCPSVCPLLCG